jgi:SAM-dependent methyltransferase
VTIATFDPAAYKATTRSQWQDAAKAWHRWDPVFDRWLGEATDLMLDLARIRPGARVLDIAAGSGGQSIAAARRAGPTGVVLATDISANILDEATAAARAAGLTNVATRVMDGEALEVDPASFDAAISRLGLMYLPDKRQALARARAVLRPGGRYAALVFAEADHNGFFSIPISIIRANAMLPPPAPGLPGPFSATDLGELLEQAGFRDVEVHRVDAPLELADAAECARLERESFGALHQMLAGLTEPERQATWAEIEEALRQFEGADGFIGPCELLVGGGSA